MANIVTVDGSHLLYNEFYGQIQDKPILTREDAAAIIAAVLALLVAYKRKMKADSLIVAFDDKDSWRSDYTKRHGLKPYRSNRNKFKTLKDKRLKEAFDRLREHFIQMLKKQSGVVVVRGPKLEADDLISGLAQRKKPEDTMDIITLDKDTAMLAAIAGVTVWFMRGLKKMSKKNLDIKKTERILRGRPSYSVRSVFQKLPRRLWNKFKNGKLTLGDLFRILKPNKHGKPSAAVMYQHNLVLLDMMSQPKNIKRDIDKAINDSFTSQKL